MRLAAIATIAAVAAAVPADAGAFQWTARAGVDYRRQDAWEADGERTTLPRLDLNLSLDTRGFLFSPDTFDWSAAVEYRRLTMSFAREEESLTEGLTYRLRTVAFGSPRSTFTLSLFADRTRDELSTGSEPSGTIEAESYGATARLQLADRPRLDLGYNRHISTQTNPILGEHRAERDVFSASVMHGISGHGYTVNYRGTLSDGTFVTDDFDEHRADVTATANLGGRTRLHLTDAFYRRTPTTISGLNPRQDANSLVLRVSETPAQGERDFEQASYSYTTGFSESPVRDTASRAAHRVTYQNQHTLRVPEWWVLGTVTLSLDETQLGDVQERFAGQSLGATGYWRRTSGRNSVEVHAGPTFGLLERFDGRVHFGYGGTAGAILQRMLSGVTARARYDVDYASEVAEPGWSLAQRLTLGADGNLGRGVLSGQLQAWARRTENGPIRSAASRSATGIASYSIRKARLELRLTVQDNLSGGVMDLATGDGLFIAPPYDSHVRAATLLGSAALTRQLSVTASSRITSTSLPDRPRLEEVEARGGFSYSFGAFGLSVDEGYIVSSGDGRSRRVNEVFVRAHRVLGGGQGTQRR